MGRIRCWKRYQNRRQRCNMSTRPVGTWTSSVATRAPVRDRPRSRGHGAHRCHRGPDPQVGEDLFGVLAEDRSPARRQTTTWTNSTVEPGSEIVPDSGLFDPIIIRSSSPRSSYELAEGLIRTP